MDIRLVNLTDLEAVRMDWLLKPTGELDTSEELSTAVLIALGTDRLAYPDDTLPDPDSTDRRGWWADMDAEELHGAWPIGSRLWLLERAKITDERAEEGAIVGRIEDIVREAMQPFLDTGVATALDIAAARTGMNRVEVTITLYRGPEPAISLRYAALWSGVGG